MAEDTTVVDPEEVVDAPKEPEAPSEEVKAEEEVAEVKEEEPVIEEEEELKEEDIPVRKDVAQHIIARQKRTIDRLRSKEVDSEEEVDNSLDPDTQDAVGKLVDRKLSPLIDTLTKRADEDELQGLIAEDASVKKFEKRIKAYMDHPQYKGVPASVIYHHLAFSDASKASTKRKVAADTEAEQMRGGGTTRRGAVRLGNLPTADEISEMNDEEFEALQHKAQTGGFLS